MVKFSFLFSLILLSSPFAEDTKAFLNLGSGPAQLIVSPSEKIWILTEDKLASTENFDDDWSYHPNITQENYPNSSFSQLHFASSDTALLFGNIKGNSKKDSLHNFFLFSKNRGQTWMRKRIYSNIFNPTVHFGQKGSLWLVDHNGNFLYSKNYGSFWAKVSHKAINDLALSSVYMLDHRNGFVGSLDNKIFYTADNWKTYAQINTPIDQHTGLKSGVQSVAIEEFHMWGDVLIVKQNGIFHYTEINQVKWKRFPVPMSFIKVDPFTGRLYGISSDENFPYVFKSVDSFERLLDISLDSPVKAVYLKNGSLCVLDEENYLYKINDSEFYKNVLYTDDHGILTPVRTFSKEDFTVGAEGKHLYVQNPYNGIWTRENSFSFKLSKVEILNDSTLILIDQENNRRVYDLYRKEFLEN